MEDRREHPRVPRRRVVLLLAAPFVLSAFVLAALQACLQTRPVPKTEDVVWGVTFSQKACDRLEVDWREAYDAVLDDLHPAALRLVAYWDLVEPERGRFSFTDLDRQVAEAEAAGIPVTIVIGQKAPRWPEYHFPRWLDVDDERERRERLLGYLAEVVVRYSGRSGLRYWQVENEPFLDFGVGPEPDAALLAEEVALVRKLDTEHPVLVTDGGEWGEWASTARQGDVFGTTIYRKVFDRNLGPYTYPLTPEYYVLKEGLTKLATGRSDQRFICAELGAEPWGERPVPRMTLTEQAALFPHGALQRTVAFARETRFQEFYFWGVEWWYYRKSRGDAAYWDEAKAVIREGARPPVRPAKPARR